MAGLTGDAEGCTDLASELSRGDPVTLEMQDSDEEGNDPEDWTPDPTDAVPGQREAPRGGASSPRNGSVGSLFFFFPRR